MNSGSSSALSLRQAIEALRSGVPNREAVTTLGSSQDALETRFSQLLAAIPTSAQQGSQVPGFLMSGAYGSGKSHLFQYFEYMALERNFVCSHVVISKETPLHDPSKLFIAAIEAMVAPGIAGPVLQDLALRLDSKKPAYQDFYLWASSAESGLSQMLAASLLIHARQKDPERLQAIESFWAGDFVPIKDLRQDLKDIATPAAFSVKAVPAKQLALERFRFMAGLTRAANYAGWVLLLDEIELIGQYTPVSRGRAYGELARLLGGLEAWQAPGLAAVGATVDDFVTDVLVGKHDKDQIRAKLEAKGKPESPSEGANAERGMTLIERMVSLQPVDDQQLHQTEARLRSCYSQAYHWDAPELPVPRRTITRPMRSYIKSWIYEWDLGRLYGNGGVNLVEETLATPYTEDAALETGEQIAGTSASSPES